MAAIAFSTLHTEIQINIAKHFRNNDLINLCLTSKGLNERCLEVLYRHVDLQFDRNGLPPVDKEEVFQNNSLLKRQRQFVRSMLSHPENGRHVRFLKGTLCVPTVGGFHELEGDMISEEQLWRAMQSLTHVQSVDLASRNTHTRLTPPKIHCPNHLFQSATSISLVGYMHYGLAKAILGAIDPAMLRHLCLDRVLDPKTSLREFQPGAKREDGRLVALGAMSGLLTTLTDRCTSLRTLMLRRIGQIQDAPGWHAAAEEASYLEWASFIRSVQGTVKHFTFEQVAEWLHRFPVKTASGLRIMDDRFQWLLLPTIITRNWPCLTVMEVRGVRVLSKATLTMELRAALERDARITVEENARYVHDFRNPDHWNQDGKIRI